MQTRDRSIAPQWFESKYISDRYGVTEATLSNWIKKNNVKETGK
ncbi:hypothetical protein [Dyadobacter alkalitolerans]|nr:hypothetical protein [Dyadobacter alkalitolerans]